MPAVAVVGAQWGDEGKGKLVDVLSARADFTVRWQGGANAGHSLKVKDRELVLHLVPSAILQAHVSCLIGPGTVLDIEELSQEIQTLRQSGHLGQKKFQLLIADQAGLVLECHKALDLAREESAKKAKIGTTGRGIGPAYESRMARKALLFADIFEDEAFLSEKLKRLLNEINSLLSSCYGKKPILLSSILKSLKSYRKFLEPFRCKDMSQLLYEALSRGEKVLFEGAQGALLDVFHGAYPFVTGSSTLSASALSSCGLGFPEGGFKTLAVAKAYTTRVGEGPFPTELSFEEPAGRGLFTKGKEFGATTGRKRRCGWLDLPALKYALRLNGAQSLALTKLDVLSGQREIKICVGYEGGDNKNFPLLYRDFKKARPIYKSFKGWNEDLSKIKRWGEIPPPARKYMDFIAQELNIEISAVSVGPRREQTLQLKPLF